MDLKALAARPVVRRFVLWPAAVVAVYALVGFLVLPPILRSVLAGRLSESLLRPVAIREVALTDFCYRAVKDSLVASRKVDPERIFLLEPKALAPEKKENQRDSRAVFVLK